MNSCQDIIRIGERNYQRISIVQAAQLDILARLQHPHLQHAAFGPFGNGTNGLPDPCSDRHVTVLVEESTLLPRNQITNTIANQLASALQYLHDQGYVHGNVLHGVRMQDGKVILAHFEQSYLSVEQYPDITTTVTEFSGVEVVFPDTTTRKDHNKPTIIRPFTIGNFSATASEAVSITAGIDEVLIESVMDKRRGKEQDWEQFFTLFPTWTPRSMGTDDILLANTFTQEYQMPSIFKPLPLREEALIWYRTLAEDLNELFFYHDSLPIEIYFLGFDLLYRALARIDFGDGDLHSNDGVVIPTSVAIEQLKLETANFAQSCYLIALSMIIDVDIRSASRVLVLLQGQININPLFRYSSDWEQLQKNAFLLADPELYTVTISAMSNTFPINTRVNGESKYKYLSEVTDQLGLWLLQ